MKINVAIAQFSPAVLDLKASVERACKIIESAGKKKGKEELIVAEIETERAVEESLMLDVGGHYSRPDLFDVSVRRPHRMPV